MHSTIQPYNPIEKSNRIASLSPPRDTITHKHSKNLTHIESKNLLSNFPHVTSRPSTTSYSSHRRRIYSRYSAFGRCIRAPDYSSSRLLSRTTTFPSFYYSSSANIRGYNGPRRRCRCDGLHCRTFAAAASF